MKMLIVAAVASSLIATPVLAAPTHHQNNDRGRIEMNDRGRYAPRIVDRSVHHRVVKAPAKSHRWNKGDRFDSRRAANYRVINNPRHYRLHEAPRGYRWVQSGSDAVLVGIASGVIASVIANIIR